MVYNYRTTTAHLSPQKVCKPTFFLDMDWGNMRYAIEAGIEPGCQSQYLVLPCLSHQHCTNDDRLDTDTVHELEGHHYESSIPTFMQTEWTSVTQSLHHLLHDKLEQKVQYHDICAHKAPPPFAFPSFLLSLFPVSFEFFFRVLRRSFFCYLIASTNHLPHGPTTFYQKPFFPCERGSTKLSTETQTLSSYNSIPSTSIFLCFFGWTTDRRTPRAWSLNSR